MQKQRWPNWASQALGIWRPSHPTHFSGYLLCWLRAPPSLACGVGRGLKGKRCRENANMRAQSGRFKWVGCSRCGAHWHGRGKCTQLLQFAPVSPQSVAPAFSLSPRRGTYIKCMRPLLLGNHSSNT
jgi:hypothetical protein